MRTIYVTDILAVLTIVVFVWFSPYIYKETKFTPTFCTETNKSHWLYWIFLHDECCQLENFILDCARNNIRLTLAVAFIALIPIAFLFSLMAKADAAWALGHLPEPKKRENSG